MILLSITISYSTTSKVEKNTNSKYLEITNLDSEDDGWVVYKETTEYIVRTKLVKCNGKEKTILQFENKTSEFLSLDVVLEVLEPTLGNKEFSLQLSPKYIYSYDCMSNDMLYGKVNKLFEIKVTNI